MSGVVLLVHIDWPRGAARHGLAADLGKRGDADHRRGVRHHDQPLSVLLAKLAGSRGDRDFAARQAAQAGAAQRRRGELRRIRVDTLLGMAFSNLIALAIMLATAATLHASGITKIDSRRRGRRGAAPDRRTHSPSLCSRSGSSAPACLPFRCSPAPPRSPSREVFGWKEGPRISSRARPRASIRSSSPRLSWASCIDWSQHRPDQGACSGARC